MFLKKHFKHWVHCCLIHITELLRHVFTAFYLKVCLLWLATIFLSDDAKLLQLLLLLLRLLLLYTTITIVVVAVVMVVVHALSLLACWCSVLLSHVNLLGPRFLLYQSIQYSSTHQKTAPFYFCTSFVRTLSIRIFFGIRILQ